LIIATIAKYFQLEIRHFIDPGMFVDDFYWRTQRAPGRRFVCTRQMASLFVWNCVMAAILKVWRQITIALSVSMRIYLTNNPVKFHPDPIWNVRVLCFF